MLGLILEIVINYIIWCVVPGLIKNVKRQWLDVIRIICLILGVIMIICGVYSLITFLISLIVHELLGLFVMKYCNYCGCGNAVGAQYCVIVVD